MKYIKLYEQFIREGFFDKIFGKKERYVDTPAPRSEEPMIDDSKNNSEQLRKEVEGFIKESNDIISKGKSNEFLFYINPLKYENTQFVEIVDKIKNRPNMMDYIEKNGKKTNNIEGECMVCFSSYNEDIQLLILGCHSSHKICADCIKLLKKQICPFCSCNIDMNNITLCLPNMKLCSV